MKISLLQQIGNVFIVGHIPDETYDKIISIPSNELYAMVPDWKQNDFNVRMNNDIETIQVPKAKIIGTGHKHFFLTIRKQKNIIRIIIAECIKWRVGIMV